MDHCLLGEASRSLPFLCLALDAVGAAVGAADDACSDVLSLSLSLDLFLLSPPFVTFDIRSGKLTAIRTRSPTKERHHQQHSNDNETRRRLVTPAVMGAGI